jgi:hydrogenase maturation protease
MQQEIPKENLIILGMGNKFFGDDGVGIIIAEKLSEILKDQNNITVEETNWGGFRIIDLLSGYKNAIVVDALKTGKKPAGYIHKLDYKDFIHSVRMVSFHDVNFATAVEFAKEIGRAMPENIKVFAIEVEETDHFSETLTPKVKEAIDTCIQMIMEEIKEKIQLKIIHDIEIV